MRLGAGDNTKNPAPLLASPPTVTYKGPKVAPVGTGAVILVALQFVGVAAAPLNVIVLVPCEAPKPVPVMVTEVPGAPLPGFRPVITGGTPNDMPLLARPPTVTTTFPVAAPAGTLTVMLVALQLLAVPADTPLNVTVLVPCVAPKLPPVIVTNEPTGPEVGFSPVRVGADVIEKLTWLLARPKTTT